MSSEKRISCQWLVVLVAVGFSFLSVPPAAAVAEDGSISGSVTVEGGGSLRAGSNVWVSASIDGVPKADAHIGTDGAYSLLGLGAGTYTLRFEDFSAFYAPLTSAAKVESGAATSATPVALYQGATISGRVQSTTGALSAASGVGVTASTGSGSSAASGAAWAAQDGTFSITGLPAGSYLVEFSDREGLYSTQWWAAALSPAKARQVDLAKGSTVSGVNALMARAGTISGFVAPLDWQTMTTTNDEYLDRSSDVYAEVVAGDGSPVASSAVEADSRYTVSGLSPGTYRVRFVDYGSIYATRWRGGDTLATASAVVVKGGATTKGVDGLLEFGGAVSGHVRDRTSATLKPGSALSVAAFSTADGVASIAAVNIDGSYHLTRLRPGSYRLRFTDQAGHYAQQWAVGKRSFSTANPVSVSITNPAPPLDVVMELGSAPDAPTGVTGVPGTESVTVSWREPSQTVARYQVTASPGGGTCVVMGGRTCAIHGLTAGRRYTFTVTARNAVGISVASAPSRPVTPLPKPPVPASLITPRPAQSRAKQRVAGHVPRVLRATKAVNLPRRTTARQRIGWRVTTGATCRISGGKLVAKKSSGRCRISATAAGTKRQLPMVANFSLRIKRR